MPLLYFPHIREGERGGDKKKKFNSKSCLMGGCGRIYANIN